MWEANKDVKELLNREEGNGKVITNSRDGWGRGIVGERPAHKVTSVRAPSNSGNRVTEPKRGHQKPKERELGR